MIKTLLILLALSSVCQGWKLNVRRVLLPIAEEGAKYRVFSEGNPFEYLQTQFAFVNLNIRGS